MPCHYAVCKRELPGCGLLRDETWANVVVDVQRSNQPWSLVLAKWSSRSDANTFIVELPTAREYFGLLREKLHVESDDAFLPKFQQRVAGHGETRELGAFADRTDAGSAWLARVEA